MRLNLQTTNGREIAVQLGVQGREDQEHLLLYDEDLNYWQRNWDYISTDTEISNFWNVDNLDVIIAINGSHRLEKS